MTAALAYRKAYNNSNEFYGLKYRVLQNGIGIGWVRVKYAPGMLKNASGPRAWANKSPWEYAVGRDEGNYVTGFGSRNAAGSQLVADKNSREGDDPALVKRNVDVKVSEALKTYPGYPKTKWCPEGHGSYTFDTPDQESVVTNCPTCEA